MNADAHVKLGARHYDPPAAIWSMLEPARAAMEMSMLPFAAPCLGQAPRGDGHPVMVIPGFMGTDTSTAVLRDQNGYTAGSLQNFTIDRFGLITGFFTNGTTSSLARIVLADFNNPSGLLRIGDNMLQECGL